VPVGNPGAARAAGTASSIVVAKAAIPLPGTGGLYAVRA
jgi:hypothetical protein